MAAGSRKGVCPLESAPQIFCRLPCVKISRSTPIDGSLPLKLIPLVRVRRQPSATRFLKIRPKRARSRGAFSRDEGSTSRALPGGRKSKTRSRRGDRASARFGTRSQISRAPHPPPPRPSRRAQPPGVPPTRAMASPVALGAPPPSPGGFARRPPSDRAAARSSPAAIVRLRSRPLPRPASSSSRPAAARPRTRPGCTTARCSSTSTRSSRTRSPSSTPSSRARFTARRWRGRTPRTAARTSTRRTTRRRRSTARRTATSTCPSSAAPAELWSAFEDLHECLDIGHANQVHHPLPCREIAADPGPESAVSSAPHGGVRFAEPDAVILVAIPSEKETAEETPDADWLEWSGANRARSVGTYLGATLHEAVETREGGAPAFRRSRGSSSAPRRRRR